MVPRLTQKAPKKKKKNLYKDDLEYHTFEEKEWEKKKRKVGKN